MKYNVVFPTMYFYFFIVKRIQLVERVASVVMSVEML